MNTLVAGIKETYLTETPGILSVVCCLTVVIEAVYKIFLRGEGEFSGLHGGERAIWKAVTESRDALFGLWACIGFVLRLGIRLGFKFRY